MCPFKVVENYQIKRDILTFLQNSVREPKLQYEDMKVKLFACLRIKQRIEETLNTDGPEALISTLRTTMENVRAEVKRRVSEWPDMTVRTYIIQDSTLRENCVVKINCKLTKTGDRLIFDFRGSSPEFTNRPPTPSWRASRACWRRSSCATCGPICRAVRRRLRRSR
jgi:N-methylhydantoinase B/oxoprolinase/acetone carboxylase alpha subunit